MRLLAEVLVVFPELRVQFPVDPKRKIAEEFSKIMNKYNWLIRKNMAGGDTGDAFVASMKSAVRQITLFPDDRAGIQLDKQRRRLKKLLDHVRRDKYWWGYANVAFDYLLLFPDAREEIDLDEEVWLGVFNKFNQHRSKKGTNFRLATGDELRFLITFFPERKKELHLDDDLWSAFQVERDKARNVEDIKRVFEMTEFMMFAAADKIDILPNGEVKFTMPQPDMREGQPLPHCLHP